MTIGELLQSTGLPSAYKSFKEPTQVPFLVYLGGGQDRFFADDTITKKTELYQVEYYFKTKNPTIEESIENIFLGDGWIYDKSEDIPLEDEDMAMIYYNIWRK